MARLGVTLGRRVGLAAIVVAGITTIVVVDLVGPRTRPSGCDYAEGDATISWVDFIKFDGITYYADYYDDGRLPKRLLGPRHATVRCKISDNVTDPDYEVRDGDAAFLEPGTPIYRVEGYDPTFRLAAEHDGTVFVYEVESNPSARTGGDLLDIKSKVETITVRSQRDGMTVIGEVRDPSMVDRLVRMLLQGTVDTALASARGRLFVGFELADGSSSVRSLDTINNVLDPGIAVPPEFTEAITGAVKG